MFLHLTKAILWNIFNTQIRIKNRYQKVWLPCEYLIHACSHENQPWKKQNKVKQKRCLSIDIVLKINVSKSMIWVISNVEGSKVSRLLVWVCIWIWMKPFWATFFSQITWLLCLFFHKSANCEITLPSSPTKSLNEWERCSMP